MRPVERPPKPKIRWLSYMLILGVFIGMGGPLGLTVGIIVCTWIEVS